MDNEGVAELSAEISWGDELDDELDAVGGTEETAVEWSVVGWAAAELEVESVITRF